MVGEGCWTAQLINVLGSRGGEGRKGERKREAID